MKKSAFWCLLLVCCVCLALIGGFFLGRNQNHSVVLVDQLPADTASHGKINIIGVNSPTLNPLLGRKTGSERGAMVAILRVNVEKYEGES